MKITPRAVAAFCARPDPRIPAALLYGSDAMRISLRRQEIVRSLIGTEGESEMRLTRLSPADLKEGGRLGDEMRSLGFFSGPRVVLVEGAADAQARAIEAALAEWRDGDAVLIVVAGALAARSALRKLFEQHQTAATLAIYDDPPDRAEVEAMLAAAGLATSGEAEQALLALAQTLEPGDFRQTLDKIALYKMDDATPLTPDEVEALAPATAETALDDVVNAAAEAETERLGALVRRIEAQGTTPVSICIAAARHFRALHAAASDPAGAAAALGRMRPPVWGARRDRMRRQAMTWGAARLDAAIRLLVDTDLTLRSSAPVPAMAVMERTLIRLAMMGRR